MGRAKVSSIMDSKLTLDLSDPAIAEACKNCKMGQQESFNLLVTPTSIVDGESITFNVDEVEYSDSESATEDAAPEEEAEPAPKAKKKVPAAVAMVSQSEE